MERKTRIRRKAHYEVTVIPVLREDLQDRFLNLLDIQDACHTAVEVSAEDPACPVKAKARMLACQQQAQVGIQFWLDLREAYDLWTMPLGIRDGFELVTSRIPNVNDAFGATI